MNITNEQPEERELTTFEKYTTLKNVIATTNDIQLLRMMLSQTIENYNPNYNASNDLYDDYLTGHY